MEREKLEEKLAHTLAYLGDTSDEVAAFLTGQGITGQPRVPDQCAVANYLTRQFGVKASVGSTAILWGSPSVVAAVAPLPKPVIVFIGKFDSGRYPELEA